MDFHSLKRRELQELCKKHKIPANLTNLEMANNLTALVMGNQKPLTRGRRSCLKGSEENVSENESDFVNRPAKKVRFSPQNEMIEFEMSAGKCMETRDRGRRKSVMNHNKGGEVVENGILVDEGVRRGRRSRRGKVIAVDHVKSKGGKMGIEYNILKDKLPSASGVVGMSSDTLIDEGAGRVTRAKKIKFMEDSEIESKGNKKETKADALKGELPSSAAADNVPLANFSNEEHVVVGKRSLRNRVVDVEKKKITVVEKGSRQNEEHLPVRKRSLRNTEPKDKEVRAYKDVEKGSRKTKRHMKDMGGKEIVRIKSTEEESEGIQAEKVLRRSRRHVAKVECHKQVKEDVRENEKTVQGRLRSIVAVEVKEVPGVDSVPGMMKEGLPVDDNLRKSKRNAAKPEVIYTKEQTVEVANANDKEETKKRRRGAILQEQAVEVDGSSVERPLRRSTRNTEKIEGVAATTVRAKVPQKQKGKSKKTRGKFEDSFTEEILITEDLSASEAELVVPEIARDTVINNFNSVVVDLTGYVSDLKGADSSQTNLMGEDQDSRSVSGTSVKNPDWPFTDNGLEKKAPGANGKSVHPPSDDDDTQKQGGETCTDKNSKGENDSEEILYMSEAPQTEKNNSLGGQRICSDASLNGAIHDVNELVGMSGNMIPETHSASVSEDTKEQQVHESIVNESVQLNLEESNLGDHEKSHPNAVWKVATTDTLNCCTLDVAVNPLDNAVQNEQDGHSNLKSGTLEECWQPGSSDALRLSTKRELQHRNDGSGEDIYRPLEMHRVVSVVTPISAKAVESLTELTQSKFDSMILELHKSNITLESQDGLNCKVAGESLDAVDLETHLEPRAQSPIEHGKGVEAKLIEDGDNLLELSKYEEIGHLKHKDDAIHDCCQSSELESVARNNFCVLPEQGATDDEESVVISDPQGVVLSIHGEGTPITNEGRCTEIKLSASKCRSVSATTANSSSILRYRSTGANTENENSPLTDDNAQNQENGAISEVERKEKSVHMKESYRIKMSPTTEHGDFQRCNMPLDGSLNGVNDVLNDQMESVAGLEPKENLESGCEAATEGLPEGYIGQDGVAINLEMINYIQVENHCNLLSVSEGIVGGDRMLVDVQASSKNKDENNQDENKRSMNSGETLKQEESSCREGNSWEAHCQFPLGTYFPHHELISCEYGKSDGDGQSKACCDTSDECQDPVPDASRSSTEEVVQEENAHGGAFTEKVGSEEQSEVRTESPNQQRKRVDGHFAAEACTALADGQNSVEVAKLEEGGLLKDQDVAPSDCLQHAEFDSSAGSKFSFIKDQAISGAEAIDGTADLHFGDVPYAAVEDGQNSEGRAKFEEIGHSRNPDTGLDFLLHVQFNSSARSTFSFIHDQGVPIAEDTVEKVHLNPPTVTTNNSEERHKGIDLGARKCNSMDKTLTNSSFFSECQRNTACDEGETIEENDPMEAYHVIQMPSVSKDDNSEGCDKSMDGDSGGVDALNFELRSKTDAELGLVTESMGANGNYVLCSEADEGGEMQESCTGEESGPFNLKATNEPESVHSLDAVLEGATVGTFDSFSSHGAQTPSKSCNKNEKGQKLELTDEPVSLSSTEVEKNTCSEEEVKHEFLSLKKISSSGRDGCSGQCDVVHSREEQEKDISSYEELVDSETAVEYETQSTSQQNIFPSAAEGSPDRCNFSNSWHGDELNMLFGNSVTSHKVLCLQEWDDGAFAKSAFEFSSAEFKDSLVLSNGTPAQHDDQKIGDSGIQKENEVGKGNSSKTCTKLLGDNQNDNLAESGTEVPVSSSLEMNIPPQESKGDQSFSFDKSKDVEIEIETSEATFVGEQVTMPGHDAEDKVGELFIQDSFASESFISRSHELLKESDDDTMIDYSNSESTENDDDTMIDYNPKKDLHSDALAKVAELTNLVEPEAESVGKTGTADSKNETMPAEEQNHGEAREANHQYLEDAGGVLEGTTAMHSKAYSSSSKNSRAAADDSIKSPSKPFMSTFKGKNRRTILIHGTPNKLQTAVDMKENAPNSKFEKVGTWTTVRPAAKRPALKDLLHK